METKRTIPQIRVDLYALAEELEASATALAQNAAAIRARARAIKLLADETYRRSPVHRSRAKAKRVTPQLRKQIRAFVKGII